MKITVKEPLPWNNHQGLRIVPEESKNRACKLQVEDDGHEAHINLDQDDIEKLIHVLKGVLEGKEVPNG